MADQTLDTLKQAVSDLGAQLKKNLDQINALRNDPNFIYYLSRIQILVNNDKYNQADSNGNHFWADGNGNIWSGADSQKEYVQGVDYVTNIQGQIDSLTNINNDLIKTRIPAATKAVSDYLAGLQNSPEQQQALAQISANQQVQQAKYAQQNTIWWIIGGIALSFGALVFIGWWHLHSKSKKAAA